MKSLKPKINMEFVIMCLQIFDHNCPTQCQIKILAEIDKKKFKDECIHLWTAQDKK